MYRKIWTELNVNKTHRNSQFHWQNAWIVWQGTTFCVIIYNCITFHSQHQQIIHNSNHGEVLLWMKWYPNNCQVNIFDDFKFVLQIERWTKKINMGKNLGKGNKRKYNSIVFEMHTILNILLTSVYYYASSIRCGLWGQISETEWEWKRIHLSCSHSCAWYMENMKKCSDEISITTN